MSRHPYTYSADLIRHWAGHREDGGGTKLSRADAARITAGLATVLGITKEELCAKLGEYHQAHSAEIAADAARSFLSTQPWYQEQQRAETAEERHRLKVEQLAKSYGGGS